MQKYSKDGLEWLEFDLLSDIPNLKHAVFLRKGGYSGGNFDSLNTSFDVGDHKDSVAANLEKIHYLLQENTPHSLQFYRCKQVHTKNIETITENSPKEIPVCDALVTREPNKVLMINHADCQATIFYDPLHHVVANVHAGWRGNVINIYAETIQYMQKNFGSKPSELLVCISPSLGPDDAEFIHFSNELPQDFWSFQVKPTYFDLWAISSFQLQQKGILPHHIEIASISTYSNSLDYFSYRRDKTTGRHATCVFLT